MAALPLVLASGSRYRAKVLADAGIEVELDRSDVDERALEVLLDARAPEDHAIRLARAKVQAVRERHPGAVVIGADQLGIIDDDDDPVVLHQQPTRRGAVEQLMRMSGRAHRLVNGLVVEDTTTGECVEAVDVVTVTMRRYSREQAASYVDRFEPFDSAGSYRIEDEESMAVRDRLIESIDTEDLSGVLGMPVALLRRLLEDLGWRPPS